MAGLMDIGKSGLQSYREALSVTGQNIANINTDGYKRREASLEEVTGTSGGLTSVSSQAGLGVRVDEVRRAFDEFLLNKARNATSYAASAESYLETVSQLENILIPGESNIGASIARFMESLQEVAANPNLIAPRIVALKAGESLTNSFHQTATLIKELQTGINTQSEQALSEINLLSANLANVNRNIASSGGKAQNALLDNRDAIIDKLSEYVEVAVTLENTGSATVRLGSSGNGPALVSADQFNRLSITPANNDINFFVSQGADLVRTSQVVNGKLRGLADAYKSASDAMASIDHLAFKLIQDTNAIHLQGLDLEGQRGGVMFHDVAFDAAPGVSNRGTASAEVVVGDINAITDSNIRITFDGTENLWRAYDQQNIEITSGASSITLPGMVINFTGDPIAGDEITLRPSSGAASNIKFALTRPEQVAAASPHLISADVGNASNADVEITSAPTSASASTLPDIQEVLSNSHSATASSRLIRDGAVAVIPANTDRVDLISLVQQSSARFGFPETSLGQISSISLQVNDGINQPKTYIFDLADYADAVNQESGGVGDPFTWYDARQIADLMNVGALKATNGVDLDGNGNPQQFTLHDLGGYASGKDGTFSVALKTDSLDSGSATFGNAPRVEAVVTERVDSASDIQIFTREGRHVAGSGYAGIESLITTENGFTADAIYRDDYLNLSGDDGYLGMSVDADMDVAENLIQVRSTETGNIIAFDRINNIDTSEGSVDGRRASAGQFDYQLSVGSFNVTLNEGNVEGDGADDIAAAALRAIRAQAPIASMTAVDSIVASQSISLTQAERNTLDTANALTLSYEGVNYYLTKDGSNYSITGGRLNGLTLSFDATAGSYGQIASTYLNRPVDGDAVTIAFEGEQYQLTMVNGDVVVSGGEEGRIIAGFNADHKLVISSNQGSLNKDEITVVGDDAVAGNDLMAQRFGLKNATNQASTTFTNVANYTIPEFNITRSGHELILTKRDNHPDADVVITSSASSNAGKRLTLSDLPEEDLIVFITGSDDGNGARARTLSAVYDMHPEGAPMPDQDITIRVMDAATGKVEFFDSATGTSIATRHLDDGGIARGLGYEVKLIGEIADDDAFHISTNTDGVFDNRNLLAMIALQNSQTGEGGFQKIFSGLVAEVGAEIESNRLNAEAANALKDASLEAEAMYSGVNLDTEASKLIEYQQAYQASARILQTARELFNTLMDTI